MSDLRQKSEKDAVTGLPSSELIRDSYNNLSKDWDNIMGSDTWPIYDACLSAICSLYLKDMRQPICLIIKGKSSSGKTTILNMFKSLPDNLSEYIDEVSAAGFVSQSGKVEQAKLGEVDLLPKLKNRVLITPEMGTMFSRNENDLKQNFGTLLRILDGEGLTRHGGIHGTRGYSGEYKFIFLAATVSVPENAWDLMRDSGTRILFLEMPEASSIAEQTEKLLRQLNGEGVTRDKLEFLQNKTNEHIEALNQIHKLRSIQCPVIPEGIKPKLICLSRLGTRLRAEFGSEDQKDKRTYHEREEPTRLMHQLSHMMYGRAIARGSREVNYDDYKLSGKVALSSAPNYLGLIVNKIFSLKMASISDVVDSLPFGETKTRSLLNDLVVLEVVRDSNLGVGKKSQYSILPEWYDVI